ncbi:MAG: sigma-54-dependent Fis family transcriptional regulator [Candidatus Latescibacteria bacterium]|nr:sigma-54-dependent Fis family transcriptional regulator [Candidatus Latescibacterota bacterium]
MVPDQPKVLVIDDEPEMLYFLERALPRLGFEVVTVADGKTGIAGYLEGAFDLVLTDIRLPGIDGIEVVRQITALHQDAMVVVMTAYGSIESVVEAMQAGAVDYLTKPLELNHIEIVLNKALKSRAQTARLDLLEDQVVRQGSFEGLVGVSSAMQGVYERIRLLAASDVTVLVQGETGTGKELVAQAIHNLSPRRNEGFVPINCGALAEAILESELFGHEKGAFTDAVRQKYGLIEQAAGGTLFLDEVEAMSPALQVKLLRAVQEREVLRVGGNRPISVDFRLVATSNSDLREMMNANTFRDDLYYRLSTTVVDLPPLRARGGDIPLLVKHFMAIYAQKNGRQIPDMTPEAMQVLVSYAWPGNVRELQSAMEQVVLLGPEESIAVVDLPQHILEDMNPKESSSNYSNLSLREARGRFERQYLVDILDRVGGNVTQAASIAGIHRRHFYDKMKQYDISNTREFGA